PFQCIFVALFCLAAAAPAPAPVPAPAPAPGLIAAPGLVAPGLWGPAVVAGPHLVAAPHVVSVVPSAISHSAITQVHPSPLLVKSIHGLGPVVIG
ncbi:hypothetical protein KR200_008124, partial [Drosophila serrata]